MKLNRRQIRSLIMEELTTSNRRKPLNEGIFSTVALVALGATAIAGYLGLSIIQFEIQLDAMIENDAEMQRLLAEIGTLVKDNPDMSPTDVADMAARNDQRVAERMQELINMLNRSRAQAEREFNRDHPGF